MVAVGFYVAIAAGLAAVLDAALGPAPDPVVELALTHVVPLPLAIAAGLVFARRAGWWAEVWTEPNVLHGPMRRRWMLLVPVAIAAQIVLLLISTPWPTLSGSSIGVGLLCYLLVGLGEELYFRGILLVAARGHHGETVTLLVTAFTFGFAHTLGAALHGLPAGAIAFEVAVTAMLGVVLYAARRATGTLWVPILLHALGDYARWLSSGDGQDHIGGADASVQVVLGVLATAVLVSTIREDRRMRKVA
jgi:Predicted protease of the Abi (CAAX) family